MTKVTFLGPVGATFSHDAYNILAEIYSVPQTNTLIPASANGEILSMIEEHGGYGAIAMETLAEGRVTEPLESFIHLLKNHHDDSCPFHIVGAVGLKLHFCLMTRPGVDKEQITKIVAHPKALGACKKRINALGVKTENASSNGEAARLVAEHDEYKSCAALGPRSAAEKYGLTILEDEYEDQEAVTTFFLVGPKNHKVVTGEKNRALVVFQVPHKSGALVESLLPFRDENLSLTQIHSIHTGNHTYNFAIEIEVGRSETAQFNNAMKKFQEVADKHLCFGPFEVLSR